MSSQNTTDSYIVFAGLELPAHMAWKKIEVLNTAADLLDRLNNEYPDLATKFTREILPIARKRLKNSLKEVGKPRDIEEEYIKLLLDKIQTEGPEDCIDALRSAFNVEINIDELLYYVGEENYMKSMQREAQLYLDNKILPEQTAKLWNEAKRPAPGKTYWTKGDVEELMQP